MAKIKEELLLIKVSTIHKDSADNDGVITDEIISTIEQVVSELIGDGAVIEVETISNEE